MEGRFNEDEVFDGGRTRGQEAAAGGGGDAGGDVLVPRRRLQQPPLLHAVHPAAHVQPYGSVTGAQHGAEAPRWKALPEPRSSMKYTRSKQQGRPVAAAPTALSPGLKWRTSMPHCVLMTHVAWFPVNFCGGLVSIGTHRTEQSQ